MNWTKKVTLIETRVTKMKTCKYIGWSLDRVALSGRKIRRLESALSTAEPVTEEHVVKHGVEAVWDSLTCGTSERRPS